MGLLKYISNRALRLTPVAARGALPCRRPSEASSTKMPPQPASDAGNSFEKRLEQYVRGVNSNL